MRPPRNEQVRGSIPRGGSTILTWANSLGQSLLCTGRVLANPIPWALMESTIGARSVDPASDVLHVGGLTRRVAGALEGEGNLSGVTLTCRVAQSSSPATAGRA